MVNKVVCCTAHNLAGGAREGVGLKSRGHYLGIAQIAFATPLPALKSAPKRQIIPDKSAPKRQIQARVKTPPKSNKGGHYGLTGRPIKNAKVPKQVVRNGAEK